MFPLQFDLNIAKKNYLSIFKKLRSNNFYVNLHYMPLHLSPYFRKKGFNRGDFKNAEHYGDTTISIPIFYHLKELHVLKILKLIKSLF